MPSDARGSRQSLSRRSVLCLFAAPLFRSFANACHATAIACVIEPQIVARQRVSLAALGRELAWLSRNTSGNPIPIRFVRQVLAREAPHSPAYGAASFWGQFVAVVAVGHYIPIISLVLIPLREGRAPLPVFDTRNRAGTFPRFISARSITASALLS